jgi:predicted enzyme related to lactoylglutathione lyase
MEVPGPPVFEPETTAQIKSLLAKGASGSMFLGTDDCRATIEEYRARGVEIIQEPTDVPYGVDAGVRDPFGNHIRVVQRAG